MVVVVVGVAVGVVVGVAVGVVVVVVVAVGVVVGVVVVVVVAVAVAVMVAVAVAVMSTTTCKACGAPIVWVTTAAGRAMPVQRSTSDDGTIVLRGGLAYVVGVVEAEALRADDVPLFVSHFVSCPAADQLRRRRPSRAGGGTLPLLDGQVG